MSIQYINDWKVLKHISTNLWGAYLPRNIVPVEIIFLQCINHIPILIQGVYKVKNESRLDFQ